MSHTVVGVHGRHVIEPVTLELNIANVHVTQHSSVNKLLKQEIVISHRARYSLRVAMTVLKKCVFSGASLALAVVDLLVHLWSVGGWSARHRCYMASILLVETKM